MSTTKERPIEEMISEISKHAKEPVEDVRDFFLRRTDSYKIAARAWEMIQIGGLIYFNRRNGKIIEMGGMAKRQQKH